MFRPMVMSAVLGIAAASVSAQSVTYDVRATSATTVEPGGTVDYEITASVDNVNNSGLVLFVVTMLTNTGVTQSPVDGFGDEINASFNFLAKQSGTPNSDNVKDIGAAQGITGPFVTGVGQGTPVVLAYGSIQAPNAEGTYDVEMDASTATANLANAGNTAAMAASAINAGAGFSFVVQMADPGDNTGGDNTGGDNTGGDNTGGDNTGGDNTGGDSTGGTNSGDNNNNGGNSGPCGVGIPGAAGASLLMLSMVRFSRRRRYFGLD